MPMPLYRLDGLVYPPRCDGSGCESLADLALDDPALCNLCTPCARRLSSLLSRQAEKVEADWRAACNSDHERSQ